MSDCRIGGAAELSIYASTVTVSAPAARKVTGSARPTPAPPARLGHRDVRRGSSALAGSYPFEIGDEVFTGWHTHDLHQVEYAIAGVAKVETATASYLVPPQQAVWIPAGAEHCTTLTRVRTVSVFFHPEFGVTGGDQVRVLAVSPLLREMIRYSRRWPIGRGASDPIADGFFATLGHLVAESLDSELPLRLPNSAHPLVAAAMRHTAAHLAEVTLADVCAAVGASERALRRAFRAETGMSWRDYLVRSRVLRAMALLAEPGPTVLSVATSVGFDSMSGFARAFRRHSGDTPLGYRRRITPR